MNYLTALPSSPVYEFPFSGPQPQAIPYQTDDIDALLSNITRPVSDLVTYQSPSFTLQCVPQMSPAIGSNTTIYHVSETVPIETVLRQFGIDMSTLQPSHSVNNYYRSVSQPLDVTIYSPRNRRRRLVCHEVSDSEDDNYDRRSQHHSRQRHHSSPSRPQQSPAAIHNLLGKVWEKARNAPERLPSSSSAPNLNWQSMRNNPPSPPPPPPQQNSNTNNAWQAMRNAPPPISQDEQNAVSKVWNRAEYASEQNANRMANVFNRMQQPTGGIIQRPPPMSNRAAVHDFNALRNLPSNINQPPQSREALQNFFAARNLPYGINQPPPPPPPRNQEALQNFFATRNLPYGINQPPPPPPQNQEALQNFFAARNLPYGINQPPPPPPPQNREALQDFFAARNLPYGINQPNPAVANVWSKADYAAHQPSPPPPMNYGGNRMPAGAPFRPNSSLPFSPFGTLSRGPTTVPAPSSFAALLNQSHRQHLPYGGSA